MTSTICVIIAGALQALFGLSIFIKQADDACRATPNLASWLFLAGFLDILRDIRIYPIRYMHVPPVLQISIETVAAILLTEIGTLIVWCNIEKMCCIATKSVLIGLLGVPVEFYYKWELYILGVVTTFASLLFLMFAMIATDQIYLLRKRGKRFSSKLMKIIRKAWNASKNRFSKEPQCAITTNDEDSECNFDENSVIRSCRKASQKCYCKLKQQHKRNVRE